jgi:hypothetical protein
MEAAGLVALSAVGVAMPARAGLAAAVVAVGYAVMRFELELWRGDDRRYIGPLSHNQWSCLALVLLVALLDLRIAVVTFTVMAVLAGIQRRRFVPPAIIVTSETQMRALLAAVVAACGGQCGQVGGVLLEPDGQGGVSASGAWGLLRPSELQVVVVAAAAAHNRSAS